MLAEALQSFVAANSFRGKGELCVALIVTQHAKKFGLPLDTEVLLTEGGGQVLGLGKGAVQAVLQRYGITRVLASEGGRTSRGSLANMRKYAAFLNTLENLGPFDLETIEDFWIGKVREFFAGKPFKIRIDASRGLRMMVRDVVEQAQERQKSTPGMHYAGAVLQHLVGAALDCALGGKGQIEHNCFSTADAPAARYGDFLAGDVAIHVTTSPGEALIAKCGENLGANLRPLIVTLHRGVAVADGLASNAGIAERIDVFEVEQFLAMNLYEAGRFTIAGRNGAIAQLVGRYNELIDEFETDPSLKLELK